MAPPFYPWRNDSTPPQPNPEVSTNLLAYLESLLSTYNIHDSQCLDIQNGGARRLSKLPLDSGRHVIECFCGAMLLGDAPKIKEAIAAMESFNMPCAVPARLVAEKFYA